MQTAQQCREDRIQKLADKIRKTAWTLSPYFSVFRVSANAEYFKLYFGKSSVDAAEHFLTECLSPDAVGVECRADGMRVDL